RVSLEYGPQKLPVAAARFLLGRIFRIYPVVIFSLLVTALLGGWQASSHGQAARPLSAPLLFANLLLFDVSMNGAFWALQVELLMAPVILLLYFLERRHGPRVLLGIAVLTTALAYSTHWAIWPPLSTNVFPFVLGMVIPTIGRRFAMML